MSEAAWGQGGKVAGDLLLCSSGTTSLPKIVVRTAASVDVVSETMVRAIGFGASDRVLAVVPLGETSVGALVVAMSPVSRLAIIKES